MIYKKMVSQKFTSLTPFNRQKMMVENLKINGFIINAKKYGAYFLVNKKEYCMKSTENKVVSRIYGHGRGWVFSQINK